MARFNLEEYDTVESRIKKFYEDHNDGAIQTHIIEHTNEYIVIKATLAVGGNTVATGYAQEFRAYDKEKTSTGKEYEPVNMFNYLENCETSAIGRALANFNYSGSKRPSREEMDKVNRMEGAKPVASTTRPPSDKQKDLARDLLKRKVETGMVGAYIRGVLLKDTPESSADYSKLIDALMKEPTKNAD